MDEDDEDAFVENSDSDWATIVLKHSIYHFMYTFIIDLLNDYHLNYMDHHLLFTSSIIYLIFSLVLALLVI